MLDDVIVVLCPVLLIAGFVAGVLAVAVASAKRREKRFAEVALGLGLQPVDRYSHRGYRDGVPVSMAHASEGSGKNRQSVTYVQGFIEPPLRLGLRLSRQGFLGNLLGDFFGAQDIEVGDPEFDAKFAIKAVQAGDIPRFFGHPEFRQTLMSARNQLPFTLTDSMVHVRLTGHVTDRERLRQAMEWVIALTKNARHARRLLGWTEVESQLASAWSAFAASEGHHFDRETLILTCVEGRSRVQVMPELSSNGLWTCRFRVDFARPFGMDLNVRKEGALSGLGRFFGMQDIRVGDHRFDSSFIVQGRPVEAVRSLFAEEQLRAQLVALLESSIEFSVRDDHLLVVARGLINTPDTIRSSVREVAEGAELLGARLAAPQVGAYR